MGNEDQRLDERNALFPKRFMSRQEVFEPLALPVGEDDGTLDGFVASFKAPGPLSGITESFPGWLLISMRKIPWGHATSRSASLIDPSSAMNSKLDHAR